MTVGSTSFDDLSVAVLQEEFLAEIQRQGFTSLVLQHGRSGKPFPATSRRSNLDIRMFDYSNSLADYMADADVIISHAGNTIMHVKPH